MTGTGLDALSDDAAIDAWLPTNALSDLIRGALPTGAREAVAA